MPLPAAAVVRVALVRVALVRVAAEGLGAFTQQGGQGSMDTEIDSVRVGHEPCLRDCEPSSHTRNYPKTRANDFSAFRMINFREQLALIKNGDSHSAH